MENENLKLKIPVECWTRIVGYFRPTSESNKGKKQEIEERLQLKIPKTNI